VIILKISKILIVIRFHRFAKSVYFAIKCKNTAGTIMQLELYPLLFTHNVVSFSSNVIIVEWLVSMPAV